MQREGFLALRNIAVLNHYHFCTLICHVELALNPEPVEWVETSFCITSS